MRTSPKGLLAVRSRPERLLWPAPSLSLVLWFLSTTLPAPTRRPKQPHPPVEPSCLTHWQPPGNLWGISLILGFAKRQRQHADCRFVTRISVASACVLSLVHSRGASSQVLDSESSFSFPR